MGMTESIVGGLSFGKINPIMRGIKNVDRKEASLC
jgi:hypothetical protein